MSLNSDKIHAGPARIFVGVTPAATGSPPTYTTHTDGIPASGTEVGFTEGDAVFKYQLSKKGIDVEQAFSPVDIYPETEVASLTFTCMEQTYLVLKHAFDNVGTESVAGGDAFWFGGLSSTLTPLTTCVMLTSRQRKAPTKFIITQLYKVYSVDGMDIPFRRAGPSVFKVTLMALADATRNLGDQMGYYRFEK